MVDLFRYRHWDLVSKRGIYYIISGLMLLIGLIALFTHGLNLGIDFKGGNSITYNVDGRLPVDQDAKVTDAIQAKLKSAGIESTVMISPSKDEKSNDQILVRTLLPADETKQDINQEAAIVTTMVNDIVLPYLPNAPGFPVTTDTAAATKPAAAGSATTATTPATVGSATTATKPAATSSTTTTPAATATTASATTPTTTTPTQKMVVKVDSKEQVSGTISQELYRSGLMAIIVGTILILLWIWFRYNIGGLGLRYATTGIIALAHDILTLVGLVALFRIEVNAPFIAALLTVLGFSIHDTIVIFDRIRENIRLRKGRTFAETVNISLLETLARSVNTVLTVLFTLLALFFFGGESLKPFVAAMLIGVTVGCYSSIFVASQLLVSWAKGKDKEILPEGEMVPSASVRAMPAAPQPVAVGAGNGSPVATPAAAPETSAAARDAIQRARQAGKTSKRRR